MNRTPVLPLRAGSESDTTPPSKVALAALFLLAFAFVASFPGSTWFTFNQTRDVERAHQILAGDFPTVGPVIGQTPLRIGPLHYYMCAIPLALRDAPTDIILFFAFLNALAVPLFVAGARRIVPMSAALGAGVALAVSPFLLCFGSALWNPALITPFLALGVYGLGLWIERGKLGGLLALSLGLVGLSQVHVTCGAVILAFLVVVACRPGGRRAALFSLAVICAASAIPIIENVRLLFSTPWGELTKAVPPVPRTGFGVALFRALTIEQLTIHHNTPPSPGARIAFDVAAYAWAGLVLAGGLRAILSFPSHAAIRWTFLFILAYSIAILLLPTPTYAYYFLPLIPARCLLAAHLVTRIGARTRTLLMPLAIALVLTMATVHYTNDLRTSDTGLLRGSTSGLDATALDSGARLNYAASLSAKRALGRALAFESTSLESNLRGPWKHVLMDDGGFWLRPTSDRAPPMLILHDEDGVPPPPANRLRARVAGGFAIYDLAQRATAVRATVKGPDDDAVFQAPDLLAAATLRPWPPCHEIVFDVTLTTEGLEPMTLCVTTWFGAEPIAAAIGDRPLRRVAMTEREGLRITVFDGIPRDARALRLTVRPPPTKAPRPIAVDLALYRSSHDAVHGR